MKLVHIITSLEIGGAQAVLFDLITQLKKKGYRQTLIYLHDGPYKKRFVRAGISVIQLKGILCAVDPVAWVQLALLLRKIKPECIHTVLWAANLIGRLVARLFEIPCVASLHNNYDQNGMLRNLLDRLVTYKKTCVVAVSQEVKHSFERYHPLIKPTVIRNGIDIDAVQTNADQEGVQRDALNLDQQHFVIGSVGRFSPVKRYPLLLKAFAEFQWEVPHARLVLIGAGPEERPLRALAQDLGIGHLMRWVIGQPAYRYYRLFDIFLLTSDKEGISIALLEAMSLNCCCITTYHVAEHPVLTNKVNGFVAQVKNATTLRFLLQDLYVNKCLRAQVAQAAQQDVRGRFSSSHMIAAYEALFEQQAPISCMED